MQAKIVLGMGFMKILRYIGDDQDECRQGVVTVVSAGSACPARNLNKNGQVIIKVAKPEAGMEVSDGWRN